MQQGFQDNHGGQGQPQFSAHFRGGRVELQSGVTKFMTGVYGWMTAGLGVTALTVAAIASSPAALNFVLGLRWLVFLPVLAFVWIFASRAPRMEPGMASAMFLVFSAMMGVMIAPAVAFSSLGVIGLALLVTIGMFGAMALFGWVTKKDLSAWGQFLFMAVIGLILASLANAFFVQSVDFSLAISSLVVLVFAGFTAYDTQTIKQVYLVNGGRGNLAIVGALNLYLDFINIFVSLLRLFGVASDD